MRKGTCGLVPAAGRAPPGTRWSRECGRFWQAPMTPQGSSQGRAQPCPGDLRKRLAMSGVLESGTGARPRRRARRIGPTITTDAHGRHPRVRRLLTRPRPSRSPLGSAPREATRPTPPTVPTRILVAPAQPGTPRDATRQRRDDRRGPSATWRSQVAAAPMPEGIRASPIRGLPDDVPRSPLCARGTPGRRTPNGRRGPGHLNERRPSGTRRGRQEPMSITGHDDGLHRSDLVDVRDGVTVTRAPARAWPPRHRRPRRGPSSTHPSPTASDPTIAIAAAPRLRLRVDGAGSRLPPVSRDPEPRGHREPSRARGDGVVGLVGRSGAAPRRRSWGKHRTRPTARRKLTITGGRRVRTHAPHH